MSALWMSDDDETSVRPESSRAEDEHDGHPSHAHLGAGSSARIAKWRHVVASKLDEVNAIRRSITSQRYERVARACDDGEGSTQ